MKAKMRGEVLARLRPWCRTEHLRRQAKARRAAVKEGELLTPESLLAIFDAVDGEDARVASTVTRPTLLSRH